MMRPTHFLGFILKPVLPSIAAVPRGISIGGLGHEPVITKSGAVCALNSGTLSSIAMHHSMLILVATLLQRNSYRLYDGDSSEY